MAVCCWRYKLAQKIGMMCYADSIISDLKYRIGIVLQEGYFYMSIIAVINFHQAVLYIIEHKKYDRFITDKNEIINTSAMIIQVLIFVLAPIITYRKYKKANRLFKYKVFKESPQYRFYFILRRFFFILLLVFMDWQPFS